jgi:23S rRNA G2069 N7-methylase RlmK/C1962 C5-methylase RlmI
MHDPLDIGNVEARVEEHVRQPYQIVGVRSQKLFTEALAKRRIRFRSDARHRKPAGLFQAARLARKAVEFMCAGQHALWARPVQT